MLVNPLAYCSIRNQHRSTRGYQFGIFVLTHSATPWGADNSTNVGILQKFLPSLCDSEQPPCTGFTMRIRDGRGETRLSDVHKNRILELAEIAPRDHLLLGLQLERGWRIGSIVGCHNKVTYTRKRTGEKAVCFVNLPGIRKEDVGHETIMIHFKGGKTEPDYPGEKWLRLAQELASKVRKGERIIPLTEQHGTNILRKYAKLAGVPNWDRLHNHRQRAYFGTYWARKTGRDYWKVQSLMGHKDLRATAVYVEELSLEEKKQLLDGS